MYQTTLVGGKLKWWQLVGIYRCGERVAYSSPVGVKSKVRRERPPSLTAQFRLGIRCRDEHQLKELHVDD
jgi:hypothetical protein